MDIKDAPENLLGMTISELPEGVHGTTEARQVSGTKNVEVAHDKNTPVNVSTNTKTERVRKAFEKSKEVVNKTKEKEAKKQAKAKAVKPKTNKDIMQQHISNFSDASDRDKPEMARLALRFKTIKKLSWDKLGVTPAMVASLQAAAQKGKKQVKAVAKARNKPEPKAKASKSPKKPTTTVRGTKKNINEEARDLFNKGDFKKLMDFKRSKKKSFNALGFTDAEEKKITGKK